VCDVYQLRVLHRNHVRYAHSTNDGPDRLDALLEGVWRYTPCHHRDGNEHNGTAGHPITPVSLGASNTMYCSVFQRSLGPDRTMLTVLWN
jgi:hypothetical protein